MKRSLIGVLIVTLVLLAVGVWLEPTGVVLGWMNGETFYQNRPARYWSKALTSSDPAIQARTHQELKEGGRVAVPVLAEVLQKEPNDEARWKAADLLGQAGPAARESPAAQTALVSALKDDSSHVRAVAATAIASIGPIGQDAIPALQDMLSTPECLPALRALARYGADAASAIEKIFVLLKKESDSEIRWNAARTLGKIGPPAKEAAPQLIAALNDPDALVREHAAESLGDIGPQAQDTIPALVKALHDPDVRVRRDAVRSLGQMGPEAKPAVESVRSLLQDKDKNVRQAAQRSLQQIEPPANGKR
jgi:HEAT repeat protein